MVFFIIIVITVSTMQRRGQRSSFLQQHSVVVQQDKYSSIRKSPWQLWTNQSCLRGRLSTFSPLTQENLVNLRSLQGKQKEINGMNLAVCKISLKGACFFPLSGILTWAPQKDGQDLLVFLYFYFTFAINLRLCCEETTTFACLHSFSALKHTCFSKWKFYIWLLQKMHFYWGVYCSPLQN